MAAFATASELASHLQRDLDTATAVLALDNASQQIRSLVHWSITEEVGVVLTMEGRGERSLRLPTRLLTAVASVVEDGVTLTVLTDYDWTSEGQLLRADGTVWSRKVRSVVVTYTHGYAAGSEKLRTARAVCLDLAGDLYDNLAGLRSYTVGGVSETYAGGAVDLGVGLSDVQCKALASYRLPIVG